MYMYISMTGGAWNSSGEKFRQLLQDEASVDGESATAQVMGVLGLCGGVWAYDVSKINIDSNDSWGAEEQEAGTR